VSSRKLLSYRLRNSRAVAKLGHTAVGVPRTIRPAVMFSIYIYGRRGGRSKIINISRHLFPPLQLSTKHVIDVFGLRLVAPRGIIFGQKEQLTNSAHYMPNVKNV